MHTVSISFPQNIPNTRLFCIFRELQFKLASSTYIESDHATLEYNYLQTPHMKTKQQKLILHLLASWNACILAWFIGWISQRHLVQFTVFMAYGGSHLLPIQTSVSCDVVLFSINFKKGLLFQGCSIAANWASFQREGNIAQKTRIHMNSTYWRR